MKFINFIQLVVRFEIRKHTLSKPEKLINATDENLRIALVTNLREFYLTLERNLSSFFVVKYHTIDKWSRFYKGHEFRII